MKHNPTQLKVTILKIIGTGYDFKGVTKKRPPSIVIAAKALLTCKTNRKKFNSRKEHRKETIGLNERDKNTRIKLEQLKQQSSLSTNKTCDHQKLTRPVTDEQNKEKQVKAYPRIHQKRTILGLIFNSSS